MPKEKFEPNEAIWCKTNGDATYFFDRDLPRCYLNAETQCADDYVTPVYMKGPVEFVNHTKFDLQKKVRQITAAVGRRGLLGTISFASPVAHLLQKVKFMFHYR